MGLKVLYIEDNPNNMRLIRKMLTMDEHEIIEATDGAIGINLAIYQQPDLILLDIQLASLDGFEIMSRLRTIPMTCEIPIVATTAHATAPDKSYFIASGFDDFLPKPVEREALRAIIATLCPEEITVNKR